MLEIILGLMIFTIIGIAIIAPIIALILHWFTKKSFQEGWKITSIVVLIIISLLTAMIFIREIESSFIGIAIIAPIVALILYWFTKKSFSKGWKITGIVVLIIISLLTAMIFIGEVEGTFSLSYRHALIAVGISVSAIIICLYLIIKKPFKKKWATTSLYIIGFLLILSVPILIMSSDLYSTVLWQFGASFFIILIIILFIIAPVIGSIIRLLEGDTFVNGWKLSSIVLTIILLLFSTPAFIIQYTTETPKVEQLDQQYEKMKDNLPHESSIDKVLVEVYKDGSFRRGRIMGRPQRSTSASANFVLKNYNEEVFRGTITIQAILNGKKIGEKEVKIEVLSNSEDSGSISAKDLNITKEIWDHVEFDYTINGGFETNQD